MRGVTYPILTSLCFAGSFIGGKYTVVVLEPLLTTWLRYGIALMVLCILAAFYPECRRLKAWIGISRQWPLVLAAGLTGIVGYHYFFFSSLGLTAASNSAVINGLSPVVTAVAAAWLLRERLGRLAYVGVAVACFGVLVLVLKSDVAALWSWEVKRLAAINHGDVHMMAAVLCWLRQVV